MSLDSVTELTPDHYRGALHNLADALIILNERGRCLDANAAAERLLGYTDEDLRLRTFGDLVAASQPLSSLEGEPGEAPVRVETTLRRKDGSTIAVELLTSVVQVPEGRIFMRVIRDHSEDRKPVPALREGEDAYHPLLQSIDSPVLVLDEDLTIRLCNEAHAHVLRQGAAELVGRPLSAVMPGLTGSSLHQALLRVLQTGEIEDVDQSLGELHLLSRIFRTPSGLLLLSEDITEHRRIEDALRESESRFQLIVETTPDLISVLDQHGCYRFVNSAYTRVLGYTTEQLIGRPTYEFIHPDDLPALVSRFRELVRDTFSGPTPRTSTHDVVCRSRHADGHWIEVEARWQTLSNAVGAMIGVLVISRDVTERRRSEAALRASQERFRSLVQNASDLVVITDADGMVRYASPAVERLLGYTPDEVTSTSGLNLVHPDDRAGVESLLRRRLARSGEREVVEFRVRHRDGTWRSVESVSSNLLGDPSVGGIVFNIHDVTERKRLEEQLTHQAFHDPLTGLPNRALLLDRLEQALARAGRRASPIAVLLLDLDRFKVVNESLGHATGDQLLVQVGQRLASCLQPGDTIARLGGDEFLVLIDDVAERDDATTLAQRLLASFGVPFDLSGRTVHISASIGVVLGRARRARAADLLRDADIALYEAKAAGKNRAVQFAPSMTRAARQLDLETGLREAIEHDQLKIDYQPIVDLRSGTVVALEALARWMHPVRGAIRPTEFIPIAEESGLIVELWKRIVEAACRQTLEWQRLRPDGPPLLISVNISPGHIQQPDLAGQVAAVLARTGLDPTRLMLEITENALLQDAGTALNSMRALKDLGVRLAIDDFGTGYSALSYLRRFPADSIKVDRSFVQEIPSDRGAAAICKAICTLGHALGMEVVMEGVERVEQLVGVRDLAADHAQGYYFARALPSDEVPDILPIGAFAAHVSGPNPTSGPSTAPDTPRAHAPPAPEG